jgi:hypothetical protein
MKGTVFYLHLTKEQVDRVNMGGGWSAQPWGDAYLAATMSGEIDAAKAAGLYVPAAEVNTNDAEQVFSAMQNIDKSWTESVGWGVVEKVLTNAPRSMSVGDYIVWDDKTEEVCKNFGWEKKQ